MLVRLGINSWLLIENYKHFAKSSFILTSDSIYGFTISLLATITACQHKLKLKCSYETWFFPMTKRSTRYVTLALWWHPTLRVEGTLILRLQSAYWLMAHLLFVILLELIEQSKDCKAKVRTMEHTHLLWWF